MKSAPIFLESEPMHGLAGFAQFRFSLHSSAHKVRFGTAPPLLQSGLSLPVKPKKIAPARQLSPASAEVLVF